jgi:hypothetical protein
MNTTKQLHGFPPSAWKELSENFLIQEQAIAPVEYHPIGAGLLFTVSDLYAPPQQVGPAHAAWVASEGILAPLGG